MQSMDDFDFDSYTHINCARNQYVKAYNILNEVRAISAGLGVSSFAHI